MTPPSNPRELQRKRASRVAPELGCASELPLWVHVGHVQPWAGSLPSVRSTEKPRCRLRLYGDCWTHVVMSHRRARQQSCASNGS
eukprot:354064-Chlamydomonas_euryale.AAC.16